MWFTLIRLSIWCWFCESFFFPWVLRKDEPVVEYYVRKHLWVRIVVEFKSRTKRLSRSSSFLIVSRLISIHSEHRHLIKLVFTTNWNWNISKLITHVLHLKICYWIEMKLGCNSIKKLYFYSIVTSFCCICWLRFLVMFINAYVSWAIKIYLK